MYKKPEYSQYEQDIKLAVLNEYIEFVEADEDENKWYYNHTIQLADEILDERVRNYVIYYETWENRLE